MFSTEPGLALQDDGITYNVTGELLYIQDFDVWGTNSKGDSYGWYLPIAITLPYGLTWADVGELTISNPTIENGTKTHNLAAYADENTYVVIFKIGKESAEDITISIKFNGDTYGNLSYNIDTTGLDFQTVGGYMDNGNAAGVIATETLDGITVDNVVGQTMWMIDNSGKDCDRVLQYGVWYGDTLDEDVDVASAVYFEQGGNYTMWYFSFVDQVKTYQADEKDNADYVAQPGLYTMKSWYVEDNVIVVVGTAQAYMTGAYDTGFDSYNEAVRNQITGNLGSLTGTGFTDATVEAINEMNIRDRTLWMSYFQYGYDSGDYVLRAEITFDGNVIYTENMNDANGNRVFLASFDDQLAKAGVQAKTGVYSIAVVAYMADDTEFTNPVSIIASDELTISPKDSDVTFGNTEYTDIWGTSVAMMQDNLRFSVDQENNVVTVYGNVYYIESFEKFWGAENDKPGYYFVFSIEALAEGLGVSNDGGFLWYDATVTVPENSTTTKVVKYDNGLDGTFIFYLGNDTFTKEYKITVDFDGNVTPDAGDVYNAPFYNSTEYKINVENVDIAEPSYNLILSEEENGITTDYVYKDGILSVVTGERFYTIHNGPNGNYSTAYWMPGLYENGVWTPNTDEKQRISADTLIDLAYYDALDGVIDYTVKLFAVYEEKGATGGSAATNYTLEASIEDGRLIIKATGVDGTVNANFGFTYVLHARTMGSEGWEVDKWKNDRAVISGLAANGTASAINDYAVPSDLESGDRLDITLTVVSGNNTIECGTTTVVIQ